LEKDWYIKALLKVIDSLAANIPKYDYDRFYKVATNLKSEVSHDLQEATAESLDAVLDAWKLPAEVN
jgi:hypothetical protein